KQIEVVDKINEMLSKRYQSEKTPQSPNLSGLWGSVVNYSHSIVLGGLLVTSYTTRLSSSSSSTILYEIFSSTSHGIFAQFDVTPSTDVTARMPIVWTYVRFPSFTPTLRIFGKTVKYCQISRASPAS